MIQKWYVELSQTMSTYVQADSYEDAVQQAKDLIAAGEVFQSEPPEVMTAYPLAGMGPVEAAARAGQ